jgi:hypothetical protein
MRIIPNVLGVPTRRLLSFNHQGVNIMSTIVADNRADLTEFFSAAQLKKKHRGLSIVKLYRMVVVGQVEVVRLPGIPVRYHAAQVADQLALESEGA